MKSNFSKLMSLAKRLHESEQGAEGLEKLMIIGAVVIPLLGVLIAFRTQISDWVQEQITAVTTDANTEYNSDGSTQ